MSVLKKIVVKDFRNIEFQEIEFSPNINCISGGNGEGKTNLLDAIWYISMTKSALGNGDSFNFRFGSNSFSLCGTYSMPNGTSSKFSIEATNRGEKKIRRDDKAYGKISDHIGILPIVMVSPSDISLVSESGDERRKFINSVLSQMDKAYLSAMQQYNRYLLQRNKLLKAGVIDDDLLCTFDEKLSALATPIYEKRKAFSRDMMPVVQRYYAEISGGKEEVGMEYHSDIAKGKLSDILRTRREKDSIFKYTSAGIQRDDFIFTMNGHPIRRCGSQGQQKSFLVALKFSQYELMCNAYGYPPIMLLDDLFDKLDPSRVENLLRVVSDRHFGQIFLTDPDRSRTKRIVDSLTEDRAYFTTAGGVFTKADE